jgi:hypothetical protein
MVLQLESLNCIFESMEFEEAGAAPKLELLLFHYTLLAQTGALCCAGLNQMQ